MTQHNLTRVESDPKGYGDGLDDRFECSCGIASFDVDDGEGIFEHAYAAGIESVGTPMVLVEVEGGIAEATRIGKVRTITIDWDNVEGAEEAWRIEEDLTAAEALPDSFSGKAAIVERLNEALASLQEGVQA